MTELISNKVRQLIEKGVRIPAPASVEIDDEVSVDRISGNGVVISAGSRITGGDTLILSGARIGAEAPATVNNCLVGPDVRLQGGYFSGAVFLEGARVGSSAHVRPGTILEEYASAAHAVGLKQSILFPYVTLGSLINFCDVFMSGGTGPKHHSEVGSSYIHFNFTPNQDKATASLLGDVPQGVMLDCDPIFLGGQGGLVGPCRLAYGTIIAAGTIYRKDESTPGRLLTAGVGRGGSTPYTTGIYRSVKRVVSNNLIYLANLMALAQWYRHARRPFFTGDDAHEALWQGMVAALEADTTAHIRNFSGFVDKLERSVDGLRQGGASAAGTRLIAQQEELLTRWPEMADAIDGWRTHPGDEGLRDRFLGAMARHRADAGGYLQTIHSMAEGDKVLGRAWLADLVDQAVTALTGMLPGLFEASTK